MRFLIDEALPRSLAPALARDGHDALLVADSAIRGASDATVWLLAGRETRIVLTRDRGFVHPGLAPAPAGIVVFRLPELWTGADITCFISRAISSMASEDVLGHITVVEPGRTRRRRLPRPE